MHFHTHQINGVIELKMNYATQYAYILAWPHKILVSDINSNSQEKNKRLTKLKMTHNVMETLFRAKEIQSFYTSSYLLIKKIRKTINKS